MEQDTIRVSLGDGQWWEIRDDLTYGQYRELERLKLRAFRLRDGVTAEMLRDNPGAALEIDLAHLDNTAVEAGMLLRGTVAWSWPEAVTEEAIAGRRGRDARRVVQAMYGRYEVMAPEAEVAAARERAKKN